MSNAPLAIVGIAARFAGAANAHEYWRNVLAAKRNFHAVPRSRWDHSGFFDPVNPRAVHHAYSDQVAFVENVDQFAAQHYRLSPSRVHAMDPQHRLLLDAAREAWIDAGFERRNIDRSSIGVFVGISAADYRELTSLRLRTQLLVDGSLQEPAGLELAEAVTARGLMVRPFHPFSMPGCLQNMGPALVSSILNLGGPSFSVDAACSSSLVALHQAIAAVRSGQCSAALVGGVYLSLVPDAMVAFSRIGALSRSGVCRPFDGDADGFVLGEGAGMVVIKSLDDAIADGDDIYAVIRGSGTSNDGKAEGPMTPTVDGQLAALSRAHEDAASDPADLSVVEAHGTATVVGDRVELESLARFRELGSTPRRETTVTSVKALIGHSMAAAGIASVIKAALMARHRMIPGQPEFVSPAHAEVLARGQLAISSRTGVQSDDFGLVGVSSFGFGGTNVHVVLESPPAARGSSRASDRSEPSSRAEEPNLLIFSASNFDLLVEHLGGVRAFLQEGDESHTVAGIARTLSARTLAQARLSVVCRTLPDLLRALDIAIDRIGEGVRGALDPDIYVGEELAADDRKIAFVFPGQGSQSPHMLGDLYSRFSAFRRRADELNQLVTKNAKVDALGAIYAADADTDTGVERLKSTDICQPALTMMGLSLVALLSTVRVRPDVVLGHSVGELSAAATAEALSASDAATIAAVRGHHMNIANSHSSGGMMALACDPATAMDLLDGIEDVWPAAYNDPRQTVVSGTLEGLGAVARLCEEKGVSAQALQVANGFHSPLLEPIRGALVDDLAQFTPSTPTIPLISTVTGRAVRSGQELREHLVDNVFSPVKFSAAVDSARESGAALFVQIGGGSALLGSLRRCVGSDDGVHIFASSAFAPDDATTFLNLIGRLTALGVDTDISTILSPGNSRVPLPIAPLPKQSYWVIQPTVSKPETSMSAMVEKTRDVLPVVRDARELPPRTEPVRTEFSYEDGHLRELISLMNRQLGVIESSRPSFADPRNELALLENSLMQTTSSAPQESVVAPVPVSAAPQNSRLRAEVQASILGTISQISGYPLDLIREEMNLIEALGFDSLMVRELVSRIHSVWPALPVPAELGERFSQRPIVGEIIDYVFSTLYPDIHQPGVGELLMNSALPTVDARGSSENDRSVLRDLDYSAWPSEVHQIESFPEARALQERLSQTDRNPYFLVHEGLIGNTTKIGEREMVSFSSYNYLGLSGHPLVGKSITEAVSRYGSSVSASRFLSGERPIHADLENELAALLEVESALVMVSGHATNVSVIGHLVGPGDLIVHDGLAHDSIIQGAKLSGATRRSFPHNDVAALDQLLGTIRNGFRRVLIVVEGVYSMDGDLAPLPQLIEIKKRHGALVMVDEAHSIGTVGQRGGGVGEYFGVDRTEIDVWSGTMSKSLAGCGGYIAGTAAAIDYLKYSVPGFVYSVGISPANTAASLAALRVMREEPQRLTKLRYNSDLFRELAKENGIDIGDSHDSPVIPCIVGSSERALALSTALFDAGFSVNPILYPAVPDEMARLRFFVTADHTEEQIRECVSLTARELERLSPEIAVTA